MYLPLHAVHIFARTIIPQCRSLMDGISNSQDYNGRYAEQCGVLHLVPNGEFFQ